MIKSKHLILIFLPVIILAGMALFVRILQYEPLYPKFENTPQEDKKEELKVIPIFPEDPITGAKKSPKTLIIFEDIGCAKCKDVRMVLNVLQQKNPNKFKIVTKFLPVIKFPYSSETVHDYAFCAGKQGKFDVFVDMAFANNDELSKIMLETITNETKLNQDSLRQCLVSEELKGYKNKNGILAESLGVTSVPAAYLNNEPISVPSDEDSWKGILNLTK